MIERNHTKIFVDLKIEAIRIDGFVDNHQAQLYDSLNAQLGIFAKDMQERIEKTLLEHLKACEPSEQEARDDFISKIMNIGGSENGK